MSNITFQVPRLSSFVFKKISEKKIFTIIFVVKSLNGFGWNNVGGFGWGGYKSCVRGTSQRRLH